MEKAVVFNVMHFSIHDGPGIRTTVFFKGCPLSCKWCHNPEGMDKKPFLHLDEAKCIGCGYCRKYSEHNNCPSGAREIIGYEITVSGLMKEIKKDLPFYEQSGGGVTFSGGEPLFQANFLLEALAQCKEAHIPAAIDTSGYCDTEALLKAAETASHFLYDIKFMDSKNHEKYCGVPNKIILENLRRLGEIKTKILIRIPLIPTINDDLGEMRAILDFIEHMDNIEAVHLLPYHYIHRDKYKKLGVVYELSEISGDESPNLNEIKKLFSGKFQTKVGG